jgi:hypothetical protein
MDQEREDFDEPGEWRPPPRWVIDTLLCVSLPGAVLGLGWFLYKFVIGR